MLIQTVLPDELIICDDGSSDRTIDVVESFASTAPFSVKVYKNDMQPLGSTKNFEKAISLCKGDIIVLSDQDDVWMPNKLVILQKAINDGAGLVFSDAELVDEHLIPLDYSLFGSFNLSRNEKHKMADGSIFDVLMRRNIVTGATAAFSRQHLPLILPISNNWIHDAWIALLIASVDKVTVINHPLIKYRQHSQNQIGQKKLGLIARIDKAYRSKKDHHLKMLNGFKDLKELVVSRNDIFSYETTNVLQAKIDFLTVRYNIGFIYTSKPLFKQLIAGNYHKFSMGYSYFFRDLFVLIRNRLNHT